MNSMKLLVFKLSFSNNPIIIRLSASSTFFNILRDLHVSSSFVIKKLLN
jgi:hypothetical protein